MNQTTSQRQRDRQMRKGRRAKPSGRTTFAIVAVLGAIAVVAGLLILPGALSGGAPRETEDAFSVPTLVGQPAPEFIATDADGQPFTFKPGDGRAKALVFYMGFR